MTIKSDRWIREMASQQGMIDPFEPEQVRLVNNRKVISYGTSSYGYDVRCASEFKIFTNVHTTNVVDPKNFDEGSFVSIEEPVCVIPPNSFALARTVEYFRIPKDVLTVCLGKSTYARCGIIVNVTPSSQNGKGMSHWNFQILLHYPPKYMQMRELRRCFFINLMSSVK